MPKIERELSEMVDRLAVQASLLSDYLTKASTEKDERYFPEIATKLRVLLVRSKQNTPLLLETAARLQVKMPLTLDGPPVRPRPGEPGPGDTIELDAFFDLHACTVRTEQGLVSLTKRQLIRAWCEQMGGAHEDWAIEESVVRALRSSIRINGLEPSMIELMNCARTALAYSNAVVEHARQQRADA
jgi:hypothetical protein